MKIMLFLLVHLNVMQKHFSDLSIELVERFSLNNSDLVVEIGNNDGGMVKYLKDSGHKSILALILLQMLQICKKTRC